MPLTLALPTTVPSRRICTCSPALSAALMEPESSGVVSLVAPPLATLPCCGSRLSVMSRIWTVWLTPAVLSVRLWLLEAALRLPAASTTRAS